MFTKHTQSALALFPRRYRRRVWLAFLAACEYRLTAPGVVEHLQMGAAWHLSAPGVYSDLVFHKRLLDWIRLARADAEQLAAQALTVGDEADDPGWIWNPPALRIVAGGLAHGAGTALDDAPD